MQALNSSAWQTADFAAWSNQNRSRLRPLWLIFVCPLCLPELHATRLKALNFCISLASSNPVISPISTKIPDSVCSPIPAIARICLACGISLHFWWSCASIRRSYLFSARICATNHCTACFPASLPFMSSSVFWICCWFSKILAQVTWFFCSCKIHVRYLLFF